MDFFFRSQCEYDSNAVIYCKDLNLLEIQIRDILKLKTESIIHSVTEAFTTIHSKDLKLQTCHSLKLKTDYTINSLTVIYRKGPKLY